MMYLNMSTIQVSCGIPKQPEHYATIWVKAVNNWKSCLQYRKHTDSILSKQAKQITTFQIQTAKIHQAA